ncbi:TIR domain-containing protein [Haliscomenobacter sp.]|uniref:TIR domain-containing protein n=1 Tax=Haliscomenobacter sp. TaxID=2717303 RepID=UPI003BAAF07C
MSPLRNIKKTIFGYDIFVSYSRKDSLDYAYAIAQHFMKKGFDCYIDQLSSITPGRELPSNIKDAVKQSTAFVLIGSEGAQTSEAIEQEIILFLENNKNKPLIPITIAGAINEITAKWYKKIGGLALIDDTLENLKQGLPAQDILDRIENALKFTKKSARLKTISLAVLFGVLTIFGLATFFTYNKAKEAKVAITEKNRADSLKNVAFQQLSQANELKNIALSEKKDAINQMQKAIKLKNHADSLKSLALKDKTKAERLKSIADSLKIVSERRVDHLNQQGEMLENRIAAMRYLESDPVKAYRFAEEAYNFEKSPENRELVLSAVSSIDFYYKSVFNNYQIIDLKDPYILLIDNSKENRSNLAVYNTRTSSLKVTSLITDRIGWIILTDDNSYKILTRNWKGEGLDAIPEYQLWNDSSIAISDKVYGSGFTLPNFINRHTVSIKLSRQPKTMVWDLLSGNTQYLLEDRVNQFGGYFRQIYGALDIRSDGIAAAHHDNGLVLVDPSGKIDSSTYTQVDFDPSSFFSRAKWSFDDSYLALNYFDRKRLGIWNPLKNYFVWLDPDGWVVNSFAWSQKGHLLAFSGRTENDVDVTVEVVDASSPEKTRKVVYSGEVPIQSISFLPGDEKIVICDKESNMFIIEISSKKVVGKGHQADVVKSSSSGFYSSSVKDFKSWNTTPSPSKSWFFKSDSTRTYHPEGAVDPLDKWMAVPYFQKSDTTSGVELRSILTGAKKSLEFSGDYVHRIVFSTNGNWLVLETSKEINLWNCTSWSHFKFPLIQGDRQFINLEFKSDTLFARLAEDSAGYEIEYLLDLKSTKPKFIKRMVTNRKSKDRYTYESREDNIEGFVKGWKMDKLYKYRAAGWVKSGNWGVRLTCRDNALGARDCDVLFVPTDLIWLMKVYDGLLWKPTKEELKGFIRND